MSGSLILFPFRLGVRATGLAVRGAWELVEWAAGLAGLAPEAPDFHAEPAEPPTRITPPERPTQTQTAAPEPVESAESALIDRGEPVDYDAPEPTEPAHLETEDELVGEVADAGAEDGAGAQVSIAEPWSGYRELRAADVIERLATASPEELAAIELYELASGKRQTVVAAAQRELSSRS
jgi:hypothetical protein